LASAFLWMVFFLKKKRNLGDPWEGWPVELSQFRHILRVHTAQHHSAPHCTGDRPSTGYFFLTLPHRDNHLVCVYFFPCI